MKLPFALGELLRDVSVGQVERPDLVWVSPVATEETDGFLQQVPRQPAAE
jgi:hypothetical protein